MALSLIQIDHIDDNISAPFEAEMHSGSSIVRNLVSNITQKQTYVFGPSVAVQYANFKIGAGVSVLYNKYNRNYRFSAATITYNGQNHYSYDVYQEIKNESFGLFSIIGFQMTLLKEFSIGLSFRTPTYNLSGSSSRNSEQKELNPHSSLSDNYLQRGSGDGDYQYNLPMSISSGISWHKNMFSFSFDVTLDFSNSKKETSTVILTTAKLYQDKSPEMDQDDFEKEVPSSFTTSFYSGLEVNITKSISISAGAFYDPSIVETEDLDLYEKTMDYIGATAGVNLNDNGIETTLGVSYMYGTGEMNVEDFFDDEGDIAEIDAKSHTLMFFIAGALDFGRASTSVEKFINVK